jgi:hypothetical protein
MLILEQFDSWLFNDPSISHNGTSEPLLTLAQRVVSSLIFDFSCDVASACQCFAHSLEQQLGPPLANHMNIRNGFGISTPGYLKPSRSTGLNFPLHTGQQTLSR